MPKKRDEKKDIRNFSLALAVLLGVFGALAWYNQRPAWPYLAAAAVVSVVLGVFIQPAMRPVFRGWMWFAHKLNWLTTRILLTTIWIALFVPIGLILRLFQVDFFDRKWDPHRASYWRERPRGPYDRRRTERLG
jgi:hypothetical protein